MNRHIENILRTRDKSLTLLENIVIYIQKHSNEIDMFEMADIIKEDKIFYDILMGECRNHKMLKISKENTLDITQIFS